MGVAPVEVVVGVVGVDVLPPPTLVVLGGDVPDPVVVGAGWAAPGKHCE